MTQYLEDWKEGFWHVCEWRGNFTFSQLLSHTSLGKDQVSQSWALLSHSFLTSGMSHTLRMLLWQCSSHQEERLLVQRLYFLFLLAHITSAFRFLLPDGVVTGPGLQLQLLETGMISKQETVTMSFNLYVRIPKGLMGWDVLSLHLAHLGLTVTAAVWPGGEITHQLCTSVNSPCLNRSGLFWISCQHSG